MAKYDVPITFRAVDKVGDGVKSVGASLGGLLGTFGKIGAAAGVVGTALAGLGATAALARVTGDAIALDTQLQRVNIALGGGSEAFAQLKASAIDASNETGIRVEDVTRALEALAREGLTAAEGQAQLRTALDFSRLAGIDAAEAVRLLGDAVGAYGLDASESAKVADTLTAASIRSGLAVGEFAQSIKTVGPAAADAGLNVSDTAAIITRLAQNGIEGGRAVGALAQVLGALRDPASRFSQELDGLGISTRDFNEVIAELGKRGPEAESALLSLGDRGTLVLRALSRDGGAALQDLRGELEQTVGATTKAADQLNKDFGTQLQQLGQTVRNAFVDLIDVSPLQDELGDLVETVRGVADSPAWDRIGKAFSDILAALGELGRALTEDVDLQGWANDGATSAERVAIALRGLVPIVEGIGDTVRIVGNVFAAAFQGVRVTILSAAKVAVEFERTLARLPGVSEEYRASVERVADTVDAQLKEAIIGVRTELVDTVAAVVDLTSGQEKQSASAQANSAANARAAEALAAQKAEAEAAAAAMAALAAQTEAAAASANKLAVIKPIPQAEQDFLAAATAADRLAEAQSALTTINQNTAESSNRAAGAANNQTASNKDAADSSKDAAAAGNEQSESMNNLTLALFDTSEQGLRKYMAANREAIISARAFATAVNRVTAEIKGQEKDANAYLDNLRAQTTETDELTVRMDRLRNKFNLLGDAKLRELAIAEQRLAKENEAFSLDRDRALRAILDSRKQSEAQIAADNAVAANRERLDTAAVTRSPANVQTPSPVASGNTINVTINGLIGGDRQEFLRQLAQELQVEFRRLGLLAR